MLNSDAANALFWGVIAGAIAGFLGLVGGALNTWASRIKK